MIVTQKNLIKTKIDTQIIRNSNKMVREEVDKLETIDRDKIEGLKMLLEDLTFSKIRGQICLKKIETMGLKK